MRLLIVLLLVSMLAEAQQASPSATPPQNAETRIDFYFEANIRNLLEMIGLRRGLVEKRDQAISDGRSAMERMFPNASQEFREEWERRFRARLNVDDFISACVRVYAKYFTDDEVKQQIAYRTAQAKHEEAALSPALQKKMTAVMPAVQRDFEAEGTRIGSKLGTDIGIEIEKEHPEWVKKSTESSSGKE